jgi:hypothetical protein
MTGPAETDPHAQITEIHPRATLVAACLGTTMMMLDVAVVNTAIPHIATDLHTGLGALKWVVDAYALALATTVLTIGSLADRFGRRDVRHRPRRVHRRVAGLRRSRQHDGAVCGTSRSGARGVRAVCIVAGADRGRVFRSRATARGRWPPTARRSVHRSPSDRSSAERSPAR